MHVLMRSIDVTQCDSSMPRVTRHDSRDDAAAVQVLSLREHTRSIQPILAVVMFCIPVCCAVRSSHLSQVCLQSHSQLAAHSSGAARPINDDEARRREPARVRVGE